MKWWLVLVVLLGTCAHPAVNEIDPNMPNAPYSDFIPNHAHKFKPPAEYARWWNAIGECAHLYTGQLKRITFYAVGDSLQPNFDCPVAIHCWGWHRAHEIYLIQFKVTDSTVVEHEMLHEKLYMKRVYQSVYVPHDSLFAKCHV